MNKKALEILEYNRIIEMLVNETGSELSAEMAGKLEPSADPREISENLRSTTAGESGAKGRNPEHEGTAGSEAGSEDCGADEDIHEGGPAGTASYPGTDGSSGAPRKAGRGDLALHPDRG